MRRSKTTHSANAGFSLVEVMLALSIASVALLSLITLLPQSMESVRDSIDQTALGTLVEDVHERLKGSELQEGVLPLSPLFYDSSGTHIPDDPDTAEGINPSSTAREKFFRVEAKLVLAPSSSPGLPATHAIQTSIFWPVDLDGNPIGSDLPKSTLTYRVASLTGPEWNEIDPNFVPKIEY